MKPFEKPSTKKPVEETTKKPVEQTTRRPTTISKKKTTTTTAEPDYYPDEDPEEIPDLSDPVNMCSSQGRLFVADKNDCSVYYQCDHGTPHKKT